MGPKGLAQLGLLPDPTALSWDNPSPPHTPQPGASVPRQFRTGPLPSCSPVGIAATSTRPDPAPCPRSFIPGQSRTRTHSASATKPLTPKAKGKASREGASAPGTAGSCIPTATAAGSPDFGPKAGQRGSALLKSQSRPQHEGEAPGGV